MAKCMLNDKLELTAMLSFSLTYPHMVSHSGFIVTATDFDEKCICYTCIHESLLSIIL